MKKNQMIIFADGERKIKINPIHGIITLSKLGIESHFTYLKIISIKPLEQNSKSMATLQTFPWNWNEDGHLHPSIQDCARDF